MSNKTVVYILPHHDDEMFVIPKINSDIRNGNNIKFIFLMKSDLRLKESHNFLLNLGVKKENILSIGNKLDISDGVLHLSIDKMYSELQGLLSTLNRVDEIVCTAYEGGHNDHDVAAIMSRALAKKFNSKVLEFYLYNGSGTKGKIYKVSHPVKLTTTVAYKYTYHDFITLLKAPFIFISQLSSMAGLWPFLMLKVLRFRPLTLNVLNAQDLKIVNHTDVPLYERWNRISHSGFLDNVQKFITANEL